MRESYGWLRDLPDIRDFTLTTLERSGLDLGLGELGELPDKYDIGLNHSLPAIGNQGKLGSCTAWAGTYMYQAFLSVAGSGKADLSKLFLYKVARNLLGSKGDTGSYLRTTVQALRLFGVPPQQYYPYDISKFDDEPGAFLYAMAQNYQAETYLRLDPQGTTPDNVLLAIKSNLAANRSCVFGFIVYDSISDASGKVPMPTNSDRKLGGHAVCAVGYDDHFEISGAEKKSVGAVKFACSWGAEWGEGGFGWIPYDYIRAGLAVDWWTLLSAEWLGLEQFSQ